MSFCFAQICFRARQHLYKLCIVSNHLRCIPLASVGLLLLFKKMMFQVFQIKTFVIPGPETRGERFIFNLDQVAIEEGEVRGVLLCVQDIIRSPRFTQTSFFSESVLTMLSESVAIADSITSSSV